MPSRQSRDGDVKTEAARLVKLAPTESLLPNGEQSDVGVTEPVEGLDEVENGHEKRKKSKGG